MKRKEKYEGRPTALRTEKTKNKAK